MQIGLRLKPSFEKSQPFSFLTMSAESQPSVTESPSKEQEQWGNPMDADSDPKIGAPTPDEIMDVERGRGPSEPESASSQVPASKSGTIYREKQIKVLVLSNSASLHSS